jgi:hypothetical protein
MRFPKGSPPRRSALGWYMFHPRLFFAAKTHNRGGFHYHYRREMRLGVPGAPKAPARKSIGTRVSTRGDSRGDTRGDTSPYNSLKRPGQHELTFPLPAKCRRNVGNLSTNCNNLRVGRGVTAGGKRGCIWFLTAEHHFQARMNAVMPTQALYPADPKTGASFAL